MNVSNIDITVSILTCNRKDTILELIDNITKQTSTNKIEIIVVDNASTDGTVKDISKYYPNIRCVSLTNNIGCAGRNVGIKLARGKYVVTLDDDVFFNNENELEKIFNYFESHSDVHVINFKILYFDTKKLIPFNWFHPRSYEDYANDTFPTDYISEGAVAFRKEIFEHVGSYPDDFFLSHEGYDLAYRIIDYGYNIIYCHEIEVLHKCSTNQRLAWRNTYYDTRNYFWLLVRYFSLWELAKLIPFRLLTTFVFALRRWQLKVYVHALHDSIQGLPRQISKRKVLSRRSKNKIKEIRSLNTSFCKRIVLFLRKIGLMDNQY